MTSILNYKFKYPYLVTIHNTYITVLEDYINPQVRVKFKRRVNPVNIKYIKPSEKIPFSRRNSRILQLGNRAIWSTFITLTFSPEYYIDDTKELQKQFRAFIKHLYYFLPDDFELKYLAVLEFGELNGRVHYHMLTNIPYDHEIFSYNDRSDRKVCWHWKSGWSDVVDVVDTKAVHYLMKYVSKEDGMRTPIGKREVFCSRGLYKPVKIETYNPELFTSDYVEHTRDIIYTTSKGRQVILKNKCKVYFVDEKKLSS